LDGALARGIDWRPLTEIQTAALYGALAGMAIPLGAFTARIEHIRPSWLRNEFRHSVIAFGGGVLFAAVALVLVPRGTDHLPIWASLAAFGSGGVFFFLVDRLIERHGGAGSQLMAMMLDFIPESMALGAMFVTEKSVGILLALLIALQNYPEGFNAYRELKAAGDMKPAVILTAFCFLVPLGPLAAWFGLTYLASQPRLLGAITLFAAGGILYLIFEDIAPQAHLDRHWAPPLGAVGGFMLGLLGEALVG
jgi:ZIP family zinc transporter